jgi:hypothetical protein
MIWAFEQIAEDEPEDFKKLEKYWNDIDDGLILFAKYYRNLWN